MIESICFPPSIQLLHREHWEVSYTVHWSHGMQTKVQLGRFPLQDGRTVPQTDPERLKEPWLEKQGLRLYGLRRTDLGLGP